MKVESKSASQLIDPEFFEEAIGDNPKTLEPLYAALSKAVSEEIAESLKSADVTSYPPGYINFRISFRGMIENSVEHDVELEDIVKEGDEMLYIEWAEELERVAKLARKWAKGNPQYRSDDDTVFTG